MYFENKNEKIRNLSAANSFKPKCKMSQPSHNCLHWYILSMPDLDVNLKIVILYQTFFEHTEFIIELLIY